jgi:two-component system, OmpR family, alkaline phosphatase synthesis response regulator PhoP
MSSIVPTPPIVRKKILIADDDKSVAECLEILLGLCGYEVLVAFDGQEAVKTARSVVPDLILLDMVMPKLSGFDACKIIKDDPALRHIPVIALTSLSRMGNIEKAYSAGADDYQHKPFDNDHLLEKVKKLLQG